MFKFHIKWAAPILIGAVLAIGLLAGAPGLPAGGSAPPAPEHAAGTDTGVGDTGPAPLAIRGDVTPEPPVAGPAPGPTSAQQIAPDAPSRRPLTRAELAELLADAFDMPSMGAAAFSDVHDHPARRAIAAVSAAGVMDGWFDGTFRPEQPVSRADTAVAVVRALGLEETASAHPPSEPIFRDVPEQHRAYAAVGMAHRLGLYPFHSGSFFAPDEPVGPAEARQMIRAAAGLERLTGPVAFVNPPARTIGVYEDQRRTVSFTVDEHTLIVRNGAAASADDLREGDRIQVYAAPGGRLLLAVAEGPASAASNVIGEATRVLRELATPEQLAAIIARDWDRAGAELKVSLYNQLLEAGVTAEEAAALLEQDWDAVEEHGKRRLTELVSRRADVEPELVRAVLDQDWGTAVSHIEVEVLEYVLNYLMETAS